MRRLLCWEWGCRQEVYQRDDTGRFRRMSCFDNGVHTGHERARFILGAAYSSTSPHAWIVEQSVYGEYVLLGLVESLREVLTQQHTERHRRCSPQPSPGDLVASVFLQPHHRGNYGLPTCLPACFCLLPHAKQALSHPDEIWGVSPSPTDPSLLATCSNGAGHGDGGAGFKVRLGQVAVDANISTCSRNLGCIMARLLTLLKTFPRPSSAFVPPCEKWLLVPARRT